MNKVICDVCGTSYPETASQCPICGSAKPENPGADSSSVQAYTYVKGGRFSEKNVRKRNKEKASARAHSDYGYESEETPNRSNRGLIIVIVILLLAIAAVLGYLYITYLRPSNDPSKSTDPASNSTAQTTAPSTEGSSEGTAEGTDPAETTLPGSLSCTNIILTEPEIVLTKAGDGYLLSYTLEPAGTEDVVSFGSSDPTVAMVDTNGKITAVGPGSAVITVVCGDVRAQCLVTCSIETEPTEEPTEATTEPGVPEDFLNRSDITMYVGDVWDLYDGVVGVTQVTWGSEDLNIATIRYGQVTAVGEGTTTVYAEYNGQRYECVIRVKAPKEN